MVLFLYVVVATVLAVRLLCDVKGNMFFNTKPRAEVDDMELRLMFGGLVCGLVCAMWPLALGLLIIVLFYRGLIAIFSQQSKKPKMWICPTLKPVISYCSQIERCAVFAKSVDRPKCGVHHCDMVEVDK